MHYSSGRLWTCSLFSRDPTRRQAGRLMEGRKEKGMTIFNESGVGKGPRPLPRGKGDESVSERAWKQACSKARRHSSGAACELRVVVW